MPRSGQICAADLYYAFVLHICTAHLLRICTEHLYYAFVRKRIRSRMDSDQKGTDITNGIMPESDAVAACQWRGVPLLFWLFRAGRCRRASYLSLASWTCWDHATGRHNGRSYWEIRNSRRYVFPVFLICVSFRPCANLLFEFSALCTPFV